MFWHPYYTFTIGTAVPPPTVLYQGDGKKRRRKKRNETQELFDAIENTLHEYIYGVPEETVAQVPVDVKHGIETALKQLTATAHGYSDLSLKVSQIRLEVAAYEKRLLNKLLDDDDDFMMLE